MISSAITLEDQDDSADESGGERKLAEAASGEIGEGDARAQSGRRWMNQVRGLQQHEEPQHNRCAP